MQARAKAEQVREKTICVTIVGVVVRDHYFHDSVGNIIANEKPGVTIRDAWFIREPHPAAAKVPGTSLTQFRTLKLRDEGTDDRCTWFSRANLPRRATLLCQ